MSKIDITQCEFYSDCDCNAYRKEYSEPQDNTKDLCKWHNECYYKQLKRLEQKYNEVLKLAKDNADSNEYRLQEDDEIIRNLKEEHNHYIDVINELKKENEKLKNRKDDYYVKTLDQEAQISDLIQENEELKEENKTLEQFLSKEPLALQALQKGYASYKKSTNVFYEMVKKYKQTLQEIRKIVLENPWEETDNWIKGKILEVLESEEK